MKEEALHLVGPEIGENLELFLRLDALGDDLHPEIVAEGDDRGHPVGSGYTMMAAAFRDGLLAVPIPGVASPTDPTGTTPVGRPTFLWNRESPVRATWYRLIVEGDTGVAVDKWLQASSYCDSSTCSHRIFFQETLTDGDYVWRLQGRNPAGLGSWSADAAMTVLIDAIFSDGFETGDTRAWSQE